MGRLNKQLDPTQTGLEAEKLESDLRKRIVGQDEAIQQIINIYQTLSGGDVESRDGRSATSCSWGPPAPAKPGWWKRRRRAWSATAAR